MNFLQSASTLVFFLISVGVGLFYCAIGLFTPSYFGEQMGYNTPLLFDPAFMPLYLYFLGAVCFAIIDPRRAILGAVFSWASLAVSFYLIAPRLDSCGMIGLAILSNWILGGGVIVFGALLGGYLGKRSKR
ncbi:MAG: hypothetical protein IPH75_07200 [bacterium]|nr:hypothetical protein [bacterium]